MAGGGIYYASEYMEEFRRSMEGRNKGPETVKVIVANKAMRYGYRLTTKDLRWVEWPKKSLPDGVFTSRKELFGENGNAKRIVLRAVEKDEPLLKAKVSGFGASSKISANLADGMRAYSIPINSLSGVAGFIGPGDRVDVILTRQLNGNLVSGVIIQDLPVIAVDQNVDRETNRPRVGSTATVEVDSRTAQKLTLAQQVGSLTLTLRGANETGTDKIDPVDISALDFEPGPRISKKQVNDGTQVRIRKQGQIQGVQKVEDSPELRAKKDELRRRYQQKYQEELKALEAEGQ